MNRWDVTSLSYIRGKNIFSSGGEKIGNVKDIFCDDVSGEPEWVGVRTGFLGLKERVVPVELLNMEGARILVPLDKDRIEHEPDFEIKDDHIQDADDMRLSAYFGLSGQHQHSTRILRHGEEYRGHL